MLRRTMRKLSIFQLQRNIGKELEELPFQITKHGKVKAVVNRYNADDSTLNTSATKPLMIEQTYQTMIKNPGYCEHGFPRGLCKKGCK